MAVTRIFVTQRPSNVRTDSGAAPRIDVETPVRAQYPDAEFIYLTDFTDVVYLDAASLLQKLRCGLTTINDGDHVLMVGHILVQVLAGLAMAELNGGCVSMLTWDKKAHGYVHSKVALYIGEAE
jgi:hypothetical protein